MVSIVSPSALNNASDYRTNRLLDYRVNGLTDFQAQQTRLGLVVH